MLSHVGPLVFAVSAIPCLFFQNIPLRDVIFFPALCSVLCEGGLLPRRERAKLGFRGDSRGLEEELKNWNVNKIFSKYMLSSVYTIGFHHLCARNFLHDFEGEVTATIQPQLQL